MTRQLWVAMTEFGLYGDGVHRNLVFKKLMPVIKKTANSISYSLKNIKR